MPSASLALYAAVRRTLTLGAVLSFSLATVITFIAESLYTVFVLKTFDSKFRYAPSVAFELSLFGDAVIAFGGLVVFGASLAFFTRQDSLRAAAIYLAASLGAVYATLPNIFYWSDTYLSPVVRWIWILLMPVAGAWLVSRLINSEPRMLA